MDILNTEKDDYKRWEENKLNSFTSKMDNLMVEIAEAESLKKSEKIKIKSLLHQHNLVFYEFKSMKNTSSNALLSLSEQLGLEDFDYNPKSDKTGLTPITVHNDLNTDDEYVPYTTKPLNWHTDGYYNLLDESIHSWLLHCDKPAKQGGENEFLDHEIAYILFNRVNTNISSLMDNNAYVIPKNIKTGRSSVNSYVFSFNNVYGKLHMRFTMREKNIHWNKNIANEINELKQIIQNSKNYQIKYKLDSGQGAITNNILHNRSSFTNSDNQTRLIYRIRSKKRVIP